MCNNTRHDNVPRFIGHRRAAAIHAFAMCLAAVVNKPSYQLAQYFHVIVQNAEVLNNAAAQLVNNLGGVRKGDVQRVLQRSSNGRDQAPYVGTVNRASIPCVRSGDAAFDKLSRRPALGAADALRVIEEAVKPLNTNGFMVAF